MRLALLAGGGVVILLLVLALTGGGSSRGAGRAALAAEMHELAGRVRNGDGPQGPDAAERLDKVADYTNAGGGADEANALLADTAQWSTEGRLSDTAARAIATLLAGVDGVDPGLVALNTDPTTTTTVAPTTQPPPPPPDERRRGKDRDEDGD